MARKSNGNKGKGKLVRPEDKPKGKLGKPEDKPKGGFKKMRSGGRVSNKKGDLIKYAFGSIVKKLPK